jgi:hypothetical protein
MAIGALAGAAVGALGGKAAGDPLNSELEKEPESREKDVADEPVVGD